MKSGNEAFSISHMKFVNLDFNNSFSCENGEEKRSVDLYINKTFYDWMDTYHDIGWIVLGLGCMGLCFSIDMFQTDRNRTPDPSPFPLLIGFQTPAPCLPLYLIDRTIKRENIFISLKVWTGLVLSLGKTTDRLGHGPHPSVWKTAGI